MDVQVIYILNGLVGFHTFYFRGFVDLAIFLSLLSSHVVYML